MSIFIERSLPAFVGIAAILAGPVDGAMAWQAVAANEHSCHRLETALTARKKVQRRQATPSETGLIADRLEKQQFNTQGPTKIEPSPGTEAGLAVEPMSSIAATNTVNLRGFGVPVHTGATDNNMTEQSGERN